MVERAFSFFYVNRTSHNGVGGFSKNTYIRRGMSKSVSDFLSAIDRLPELHDRLSKVIVTNKDDLTWAENHADKTNDECHKERSMLHLKLALIENASSPA